MRSGRRDKGPGFTPTQTILLLSGRPGQTAPAPVHGLCSTRATYANFSCDLYVHISAPIRVQIYSYIVWHRTCTLHFEQRRPGPWTTHALYVGRQDHHQRCDRARVRLRMLERSVASRLSHPFNRLGSILRLLASVAAVGRGWFPTNRAVTSNLHMNRLISATSGCRCSSRLRSDGSELAPARFRLLSPGQDRASAVSRETSATRHHQKYVRACARLRMLVRTVSLHSILRRCLCSAPGQDILR